MQKKFKVNLELSEVLITHVTYKGKARVMLHIGAGQSNNHQIILKSLGYDIFCNCFCNAKTIQSEFGGIRGINHLRYK